MVGSPLDGGAEFSGGIPGDRDGHLQFADAVVGAEFEVEGVELPRSFALRTIVTPWPVLAMGRSGPTTVSPGLRTGFGLLDRNEYAALQEIAEAGGDPANVPAFTRNPRFTSNPDAIAKAEAICDGTYPG